MAWVIVIILFMFLLLLSGNNTCLMGSSHSQEFGMIPTDESSTLYVPENENGQVVFRPITFNDETTAPQRIDRRTSVPMTIRSSPPSSYVKSF